MKCQGERGECGCSARRNLDWHDSPVEDFVAAINVHNPEGVCIEHDGVCERVPCCKTKSGEIAEDGW